LHFKSGFTLADNHASPLLILACFGSLAGFFDACFAFAGFGIGGAEMMRFKASSNLTPCNLKSLACLGMAEWCHKTGKVKSQI
jgi:hypothetical protein